MLDSLLRVIQLILKSLLSGPHELLIIRQLDVLSTEEFSVNKRTIVVAIYHTLPKRSSPKSSKITLQMSNYRLLHSHTRSFTIDIEQSVRIHRVEPPLLLLPTM